MLRIQTHLAAKAKRRGAARSAWQAPVVFRVTELRPWERVRPAAASTWTSNGDGCGAFWRLRFQWAEGAASPASVKLAAGCPATGADLQELHDLETLDESELARVRAAADKWKTGLAALLGLVATVSVVKGRDSFKTLDVVTQHRIIILVGVALLFAASAALLAMRAANGPLKRTVITPR
jgi:hypothetical protein